MQSYDDGGSLCFHGFNFSPSHMVSPLVCLSRFHRPWKQGVSSVKKCWAWKCFWSCSKLLSGDGSKSLKPFVFSASLAFFQHPWLSYHQCEGMGVGEKMVMFAAVCPGDHWSSPHGSWLVEEDFGGASDSQDERRGKKNNLVIQSVLFFVLFHGLLWQGGVNPCSARKLCMWPASHFLNRWIMCHLDCVKTVQSGGGGIEDEFDINCTYSMSIWMSRQCLHWKEKYLCKHHLSSKYKVFFKNGLSHFSNCFYFQWRIKLKRYLKTFDRSNILNSSQYLTNLNAWIRNLY